MFRKLGRRKQVHIDIPLQEAEEEAVYGTSRRWGSMTGKSMGGELQVLR